MKFLLVPPVRLVPFHSDDNFSAIGRAEALRALLEADEENEREAGKHRRLGTLVKDMMVSCESLPTPYRSLRSASGMLFKAWPSRAEQGVTLLAHRSHVALVHFLCRTSYLGIVRL